MKAIENDNKKDSQAPLPCPECNGHGEWEVLYSNVPGSGVGMSNEAAMHMAGEVHHVETCEYCDGTGELPDEAYTCNNCPDEGDCEFAYDPYNTDGDCLRDK